MKRKSVWLAWAMAAVSVALLFTPWVKLIHVPIFICMLSGFFAVSDGKSDRLQTGFNLIFLALFIIAILSSAGEMAKIQHVSGNITDFLDMLNSIATFALAGAGGGVLANYIEQRFPTPTDARAANVEGSPGLHDAVNHIFQRLQALDKKSRRQGLLLWLLAAVALLQTLLLLILLWRR